MRWSERSGKAIAYLTVSLAAALAGIPAGAAAGQATSISGPAEIIDGDSLRIAGQSFDLADIDAPELDQRCNKRERFYDCGRLARAALMDLTAGAEVECRPVSGQQAALQATAAVTPRLARCRAGGYDLSEGMVYTGWALIPPETTRQASVAAFSAIQKQAEQRQRGLWKGRFVTPWEWREGRRLPDETGN
ncbi:thermonuclease family protein [Pelagibius litoralis]|uniref:Thermonuclease family protein n=1 Tax=Pelagibius litoralis TaxID=374515 RepID=A0A967EZ56_9PROT|nr:thermonuclease family protein [Pelagibius litoralis]NIA70121.1 thermonuclease family protein [Pelagibius litoralis]